MLKNKKVLSSMIAASVAVSSATMVMLGTTASAAISDGLAWRNVFTEDFEDDTKDAGEIGAGHSVTALYELVPATEEGSESGNDLKYQTGALTEEAMTSNEWLTLSIRYKDPGEKESKLLEYPIGSDRYTENAGNDFRFAAAVAEFSLLLRDSEYKGDASYAHLLKELDTIKLSDEYREEFKMLVQTMAEASDATGGNEW